MGDVGDDGVEGKVRFESLCPEGRCCSFEIQQIWTLEKLMILFLILTKLYV